MERELGGVNKTWTEVKALAMDRTRWRNFVVRNCILGESNNLYNGCGESHKWDLLRHHVNSKDSARAKAFK